jgi:hypothetical protein
VNRNQVKANALTALGESLLVGATLAAGLAVFRLLEAAPYIAVVLAICAAFATDSILKPMLTATFTPAIAQLRATTPATEKGADR